MAAQVKSEAAERDLISQWVWYAENGSIEIADRFLDAVADTLDLISSQPEIGNAVPTRKQEIRGLRKFPLRGGFEDILLFYLPFREGIRLVRVLHGRRNLYRLI